MFVPPVYNNGKIYVSYFNVGDIIVIEGFAYQVIRHSVYAQKTTVMDMLSGECKEVAFITECTPSPFETISY